MLHLLLKFCTRFRGWWLKMFLELCGCRVGKGLKCKGWPWFRRIPCRNIVLGDDVTIGKRIVFEVVPGGMLEIGSRVNLTQDIVISCREKVNIGADTLVAEFVSIRDAEHGTAPGTPIARQKSITAPVRIGEDVWIGAGARILYGATLSDGVVVAANAVVTRKNGCPAMAVVGGVPARILKMRK